MLKMIIANSPAALRLSLSAPQYRHALNVVESLIVGEGVKTLSGLSRWFVREPDPNAMGVNSNRQFPKGDLWGSLDEALVPRSKSF